MFPVRENVPLKLRLTVYYVWGNLEESHLQLNYCVKKSKLDALISSLSTKLINEVPLRVFACASMKLVIHIYKKINNEVGLKSIETTFLKKSNSVLEFSDAVKVTSKESLIPGQLYFISINEGKVLEEITTLVSTNKETPSFYYRKLSDKIWRFQKLNSLPRKLFNKRYLPRISKVMKKVVNKEHLLVNDKLNVSNRLYLFCELYGSGKKDFVKNVIFWEQEKAYKLFLEYYKDYSKLYFKNVPVIIGPL